MCVTRVRVVNALCTAANVPTSASPQEKKFYIQGMVRFVLFNESHRRVLRRQDIVKAGELPPPADVRHRPS